jgi:hypothetical protein
MYLFQNNKKDFIYFKKEMLPGDGKIPEKLPAPP